MLFDLLFSIVWKHDRNCISFIDRSYSRSSAIRYDSRTSNPGRTGRRRFKRGNTYHILRYFAKRSNRNCIFLHTGIIPTQLMHSNEKDFQRLACRELQICFSELSSHLPRHIDRSLHEQLAAKRSRSAHHNISSYSRHSEDV